MKILLVGDWQWIQYEQSFSEALQQIGHEVTGYKVIEPSNSKILNKLFFLFPFLNVFIEKNTKNILDHAQTNKVDLVFFWRPTNISPNLVSKLNAMKIMTCSYNNDDPFNKNSSLGWRQKYIWHWYIKCLPFFKFNFFFREVNLKEAILEGAKHAKILMPYFIPWRDKEIKLSNSESLRYTTDIVFVGHYEDDGRLEYIRAILDNKMSLKIWGTGWDGVLKSSNLDQLCPVVRVSHEEYRKALSGSKICLCFLSKINRDVYTRRCFEIPAFNRLLLSERTPELSSLFREGVEAEFFSTPSELIRKLKILLLDNRKLTELSKAGYERVYAQGHDIKSRALEFMAEIENQEEAN